MHTRNSCSVYRLVHPCHDGGCVVVLTVLLRWQVGTKVKEVVGLVVPARGCPATVHASHRLGITPATTHG